MKEIILILTLFIFTMPTIQSQEDCSKIGVDYQSFGASVLPYGFEELTTVQFENSLCENQYYELNFWVSKDIFLAKMQRQWSKHERMRFEVQLFLAVNGNNYDASRNYKPIIFELNSVNAITLDHQLDKFGFKIYADAPYDVLTIGYKPLEGWWNADESFVDDIISITSLSFNRIEQQIKEPEKEDTLVAAINFMDTFDFESVKIKQFNNRSVKSGKLIHVNERGGVLEISDHLEYDKDSIHVFLNETQILSNYELTNEILSLDLNLQPGINTLILEAINLGEFSPNTAAFNLKFGDTSHQKVMFSNLKQSDVIYIYYSPE